MEITISTIFNVSKMVVSLSKKSPLKKIAKQEFELAKYILESVDSETNYRECLNRALTHLESAYVHFVPTINTWDVWDEDRVLWDDRTYANDICLQIAIIHFVLGNPRVSKKWLLDNINDKGGMHYPDEILTHLSFQNWDSFFKCIGESDYFELKKLMDRSESSNDRIFENDIYESPFYFY